MEREDDASFVAFIAGEKEKEIQAATAAVARLETVSAHRRERVEEATANRALASERHLRKLSRVCASAASTGMGMGKGMGRRTDIGGDDRVEPCGTIPALAVLDNALAMYGASR